MTHEIPGAGSVECHPHDNKWVEEQLMLLPAPMRAAVARKYSKAYLDTLETNRSQIAAEGLARREANTRLRECVGRFGGAYHGAVVSPDGPK